jgi:hypothetical protein
MDIEQFQESRTSRNSKRYAITSEPLTITSGTTRTQP